MEALTFEQTRLVFVVYCSALTPLLASPCLHYRQLIPAWVLPVYISTFVVCALGWELWFNYGIIAGETVDARRALGLTQRLPLHLNWILNSLADAGAISCGGLLAVWLLSGRKPTLFTHWRHSVFLCLLFLFIGQNILVEMFLYHDQLEVGKPLSWAPLSPFGPWWNPVLFEFQGRTITLQGQLPWLFMTPLFYAGVLAYLQRISLKTTD
jgi:hypothetical protein